MTGKYALNLGIRFVLLGNMTRCTKRVASGLDGLCLITVQILTPPPFPSVFCRVAQTARHTGIKFLNNNTARRPKTWLQLQSRFHALDGRKY